ncbi:EscI/YscI/HrpB family type III secretion system inner rod protein [Aureimonas leprariae]|uniref:Uncharacterized protein n=1 Tax=Plantimonas leprariae TaxID=2615207 RepID=A0A7V7PL30_9HYPH|nr:EscI/YscI/HrpB family type III secretion system inner rod protein [Aureimonas leprariae]KAB0676852.1 hypothetical protein F6X38_19980 [Aureimonas leprariae]
MVAPVFGSAAAAAPLVTPSAPAAPVAQPERVAGFESALARHAEAAQTGGAERVAEAGRTAELSPVDRARIGLDLGPAAPVAPAVPPVAGEGGDMILNGLSKLRTMFDAREAHVGDLMKRGSVDATSMMEMQVEMVNFTLLVDVSSKLTGKTTAVFDTLMKGQ